MMTDRHVLFSIRLSFAKGDDATMAFDVVAGQF